jgi:hypothetical protein
VVGQTVAAFKTLRTKMTLWQALMGTPMVAPACTPFIKPCPPRGVVAETATAQPPSTMGMPSLSLRSVAVTSTYSRAENS